MGILRLKFGLDDGGLMGTVVCLCFRLLSASRWYFIHSIYPFLRPGLFVVLSMFPSMIHTDVKTRVRNSDICKTGRTSVAMGDDPR